MAFVLKPDSGGGDTLKFKNIGDSVTGIYLGSQDYPEGRFGPTVKHIFKTKAGIKVAFFRPGSQPDSLLKGETGKLVCLTFASTKDVNKGNDMKVFKLEVDNEYVPTEEELEVSSEDYSEDDDSEMDEVTTAPAKNAPKAAPPSASKRAAVNAFVNARAK